MKKAPAGSLFDCFLRRSNGMTEQPQAKWFADLSTQNKTIVLSVIIHWLTLVIRDALSSPFNVAATRKIEGVGEMTHAMASHIIALNSNDENRYGDEDLIEMLLAAAGHYELDVVFQQAWRSAVSQALTPSV